MYEIEFTMDPKVRPASQADFAHNISFVLDRVELDEDRWDGEVQLHLLGEEEGTVVPCPEFNAENEEKAKELALTWLRGALGPLLGCTPDEVVFESLTWAQA